jgi:zinc protease
MVASRLKRRHISNATFFLFAGEVMQFTELAPTDGQLWDLVCQDDQDAFEALVRRHQAAICAVAYNICGNFSLSEDLSQEAFWIAWRDRQSLKDPLKLRGWLGGIVRNLARNSMRQASRVTASLDDCSEEPGTIVQPGDQVVSREEEVLVWQALEQIPESYREPLILFYREDQSVQDVATTLDLSPDAVKQRLSRGRSLLREQLLQIIEGALRRSKPGAGFTTGVMAGVASITAGSKAAVAGTGALGMASGAGMAGAKLTAGTSTATISGIAGGLLGGAGGVLGGWIGTWIPAQLAPTNRERNLILRVGRRITIVSVIMILLFLGAILFFGRHVQGWTLGIVIIGWIVSFQSYVALEIVFLMKAIQKIRKETTPESDANTSSLKASVERYASKWEGRVYRSSASLFGIPFVDIQVSSPHFDGSPPSPKTAWGWIAIGDRANGILFAMGGVARGGIAVGGLSIGLVSLGGASLGLVSLGGLAIGAVALGGVAIGGISIGGVAVGWQAAGGGAMAWDVAAGGAALAHHAAFGGLAVARDFAVGGDAFAAHANDELAKTVLESHWLVKGMKSYQKSLFTVQIVIILVSVLPSMIMTRCMYRKREIKKSNNNEVQES